jgi:flagellar hook protein FlgE
LDVGESGTITIDGYRPDGIGLSVGDLTFDVTEAGSETLQDLIDHLNTSVFTGADAGVTASLVNGRIVLTDTASGYSQTDLTLSYSGDGTLTVPAYFEMTTVGGDQVKNMSITAYDSLGGKHVLSGAFVRTDTLNTWDMVLTSITGDVDEITMDNRRIKNIEFSASDGSYSGLAPGDTAQFEITFPHDTSNPQIIAISMGTIGKFDGLTQLAGNSTAVAREQDGYESGRLSTVSVDNEGIVIGAFSNGIKKNIATIQIALFQNVAALEGVGGGYFIASANSGEAIATQAMTAGAGTVHGGALEKSNSDVATEFVNMIKAQNGFQANARTIRVANDILRELTNLIR